MILLFKGRNRNSVRGGVVVSNARKALVKFNERDNKERMGNL